MESLNCKQSEGFNPNFIYINNKVIVEELRKNGYYSFENALELPYVDEMIRDVDFQNILLNINDVGVVATQNHKYLTHCLASSQKAYDIITSEKILGICKEYFTDDYKLINHRIYQTSKRQHLAWHTDNNKQEGAKMFEKHNMPGLFFMFYLSDVEKNPFQFIKGSHLWSHKYNKESFFTDNFINQNHTDDIRTFRLKKGSFIVCDIHGIHRAEPFNDVNYKRMTLLFQVDQVGQNNEGHGEKNIINTEYLKNLTPEITNYLGFGFKRNYPAFPHTSISTMTTSDILNSQRILLPMAMSAISQNLVRSLFPAKMITNMKRIRFYLRKMYSRSNYN